MQDDLDTVTNALTVGGVTDFPFNELEVAPLPVADGCLYVVKVTLVSGGKIVQTDNLLAQQ